MSSCFMCLSFISRVLLKEVVDKMSIIRQLAKKALEKQQENHSSSQNIVVDDQEGDVIDDQEPLADDNESSLGRNGM